MPQPERSSLPVAYHRTQISVQPSKHLETEVGLPDLLEDRVRKTASINIATFDSKAVDFDLELAPKPAADSSGAWEDVESARAEVQNDDRSKRPQARASAWRVRPGTERRPSQLRTVQQSYGSPPPSPVTPGSVRGGHDEALPKVQHFKPDIELLGVNAKVPIIVVQDSEIEEVLA